MDEDAFGFAPPPFNAPAALQQLQRDLRALKLNARGHAFELRGKPVAELQIDGAGLAAGLARKLAMPPDWDRKTIASAADQRQWLTDLKRRLERWDRDD